MRNITIVFTKSKKKLALGSKLIMWWMKKPYSHVALEYNSRVVGVTTYYQASEGLVNYMSVEQFDKRHEIIKRRTICLSNREWLSIIKDCHKAAGEKYGTAQNIGIALVKVASWFGIKMKNPWKRGKNCSEIVYEKFLSKYSDKQYDQNKITPAQIEDISDIWAEKELAF